MTIIVKPKYLPDGFEDRTKVNVGVKKNRDGQENFVEIFLWRTEREVWASYGAEEEIVKKKFQSETEMMNIDVNIPDLIVISSEGIVAQERPSWLGMYYHDLARKCWIQVNTETNHEKFGPRYAFRDDDGVWWINVVLDQKAGRMKNETKSEEIPTSGWKVDCGSGNWKDDPTLTIRHGPLIPLCDEVTITVNGPKAQEWSKQVGVYKRSSKWWFGHPVFINSNGKYLYIRRTGWAVAEEQCDFFAKSFNHCPTLCRWEDGITVSCSLPNIKNLVKPWA